jgi:SHS2 domain-containing protein
VNKWEHFPHSADIGIRGLGESKNLAFVYAAKALTSVITDLELIRPETSVEVSCSEPEDEYLFYDFINAIVYEMDTKDMIFSEFEVVIKENELKGILRGEKFDRDKHHPRVEIKGATLTELKVEENNGQWVAQCVVDV